MRTSSEDERVAELASEIERGHAREEALLNELAAARTEATDAGIGGISVAGKPAIAKFRAAWGKFADAVLRLPDVRQQAGLSAVRVVVAKDLVADLRLFELDAPRGRIEARERDRLRRLLDHPAMLDVFSNSASWAQYFRVLFLSQVVRSYVRPSVWRTYEKASDEGIRDTLGTVYK